MSVTSARLAADVAERLQERRFPDSTFSTSLGSIWQYSHDARGILVAFFMPGIFLQARNAAPEARIGNLVLPGWSEALQVIRERYFSFARRGFDPVIVTGQSSEELMRVRRAYNFHIPILADTNAALLNGLGVEQFAEDGAKYHPYFAVTVYAGMIRGIFFRFEKPEDLVADVINSRN